MEKISIGITLLMLWVVGSTECLSKLCCVNNPWATVSFIEESYNEWEIPHHNEVNMSRRVLQWRICWRRTIDSISVWIGQLFIWQDFVSKNLTFSRLVWFMTQKDELVCIFKQCSKWILRSKRQKRFSFEGEGHHISRSIESLVKSKRRVSDKIFLQKDMYRIPGIILVVVSYSFSMPSAHVKYI